MYHLYIAMAVTEVCQSTVGMSSAPFESMYKILFSYISFMLLFNFNNCTVTCIIMSNELCCHYMGRIH